MDLGPIEQNIAKQAMRSGAEMPERIANAPELKMGLQLYLNAFFDLDLERSHHLGITAISWSSIVNYSIACELDEDQREDLFYVIRKMDSAHLERLSKKKTKA